MNAECIKIAATRFSLIILLGLGTYLRVREYLYSRSLWLDESKLALNLMERGYAELLRPLNYHQAAPPGVLWLMKLATQIFGNSERALRLFPFLASLAVLPLCYVVARRMIGRRAALMALLPVTLSPLLIYHAAEAKQYAFDPLAVLMVLHAALVYLDAPGRPGSVIWLAVAGCLTMLFSHPVAFVTAGAGVALQFHEFSGGTAASRRRLGFVTGVVVLAGLANYHFLLRPILQNEFLIEYHRESFPAFPPRSMDQFLETGGRLIRPFEKQLGLVRAGPAAFLFIAGLIWMIRSGRRFRGLIVAVPLALLVVSAVLDRYSFEPRFLLFTAPLLALGVAAGVEGLLRSDWTAARVAGALLGLLVIGNAALARVGDEDTWRPNTRHELRDVLGYMIPRVKAGDTILLHGYPTETLWFYTRWGKFRGELKEQDFAWSREELLSLMEEHESERIWLVASQVMKHHESDLAASTEWLEARGRVIDRRVEDGAWAELYQMKPKER